MQSPDIPMQQGWRVTLHRPPEFKDSLRHVLGPPRTSFEQPSPSSRQLGGREGGRGREGEGERGEREGEGERERGRERGRGEREGGRKRGRERGRGRETKKREKKKREE